MPIPKLSFRASIVDKLLAEISFPLKRASANLFRSRGVDTIPPAPSGIEGWVTDSILHLSKYLYELHSFCSGEIVLLPKWVLTSDKGRVIRSARISAYGFL